MEETTNLSLIEKLLDALNITGGVRTASSIIIALGVVLICGFLMTRLTKLLKLPNVTAYIITGILIGPCVINLIPKDFIKGTDFISDIALAFIAFTAGQFFKVSELKKAGWKVVVITLFEALAAEHLPSDISILIVTDTLQEGMSLIFPKIDYMIIDGYSEVEIR